MKTGHSDSLLVERTLEGDHRAWERLVNKHMPGVFSIMLNQVKNLSDAQDLTQMALLQSYIRLNTLKEPSKFAAWIRRLSINMCHVWHRQNKITWVPLEAFENPGVVAYDHKYSDSLPESLVVCPEVAIKQSEAREIIQKALKTLPDKLRATVSLFYLEALSYTEIADQLEIPEGTVKRRLHDARQKLKEEIMDMTYEPVVLKQAVGLETSGATQTPIFATGLHLPAAWTKMFSTATDNQEEIGIHILQGDSDRAEACRSIATFKISGISTGQKSRDPKIRVTFKIDTSGRIECLARELPGKTLQVEGRPDLIMTEMTSGF